MELFSYARQVARTCVLLVITNTSYLSPSAPSWISFSALSRLHSIQPASSTHLSGNISNAECMLPFRRWYNAAFFLLNVCT